ncbi:Fis family transcriptional regulator [Bermanella sp. R86510]|uniref:Fis family transcriptional regulator n=1 Tax=unclassified Bermanella TaxID=2627862 RepID=UPI0037C71ACE
MKKTDKKIDNAIRRVLTDVCEAVLTRQDGFKWLTHLVDYDNFPKSLHIICVYDFNDDLARADKEDIYFRIKSALAKIDIQIKDIYQHVSFDTEENCDKDNNGKWSERLRTH